jgi:short-chain fatty acids transporter
MVNKLGEKFTDLFQKNMPDAFVFALLLTMLIAITSFFWVDASPLLIVTSWYDGFWNLLEFGMQMVLLVITGYSIALSPIAKKGVEVLAKRVTTPRQVYFFVMLVGCLLGLISWGWAVITAVLARELALRVKGVNYPFLIAVVYFSGASWVTGFSSSIPLLLNTPNNYMIEAGVLPGTLSSALTLGSSINLAMIFVFLVLGPLLFLWLTPKEKNMRELENMLGEEKQNIDISIHEEAESLKLSQPVLSDKLNNSTIIQWIIAAMGLTYIVYHFASKGFDLNLNIMIFIFLILGLILHKTPVRYGISMQRASSNVSGILFQFPFYAGIMGIMLYTGLGEELAKLMASVATLETYPFFAYVSGGIVNFAIPSAGGEFAVIGPSVISAVNEIASCLPAQELANVQARAVLSMAYGESLTNLLQPFFLLVIFPVMGAGIKIQARDVMGYLVLPFAVFFIIQSVMVMWWPL